MGSIPSLVQWTKGCGVTAATTLIQFLALKLPYAVGVAIKKKKKKRESSQHVESKLKN